MSRTVEQKRAAFALRRVQGFRGSKEKMMVHINNTPFRILNNGLGQALAFLQADNEGKRGNDRKESGRLFDILHEWLCGDVNDEYPCRVYPAEAGNLMSALMEGGRDDYMRAQEEALALFVWLKKFADAGMLGAGDADPAPEAPMDNRGNQQAEDGNHRRGHNRGPRRDRHHGRRR